MIASRLPNMKELRPQSAGRTEIRILFVFDPYRSAVPLVVGDKSGQWNRWYRTAIPEAERLYEDYSTHARRRPDMTEPRRWRDTGHLERAVETAGGPEAFDAAVEQILTQARGWRLGELRKRRGLRACLRRRAALSSPPIASL